MTDILFATSEIHPLVKTGGLGDVSASLPPALRALGEDVRVVLPAYRCVLEQTGELQLVATLDLAGAPTSVRILEGRLPGSEVPLYLVDSPVHFDREGGPYVDSDGNDWPDNAARFATFGRAVTALALDQAGLQWRPRVVHCNDWQSGLAPALLARQSPRPATLFTVHNLAYQGLFSWPEFADLDLPHDLWAMEAMEFHGLFSFIKGGLAFADWITTVSPSYAEEICTPEFGEGLDGLLNYRGDRLVGILNGVDYDIWDPSVDRHIPKRYTAKNLRFKKQDKEALKATFRLDDQDLPIIGMVGRLAEQKGVDLVLRALPAMMDEAMQLVVVGSGDPALEKKLRTAARRHKGRIGVHIGYDEALAHLVEAGADMFLMPSRYEPCGLNQIYSLRYGTAPIVRATGGLRDTVVDATEETLRNGTATGFSFAAPSAKALHEALCRALALYEHPRLWRRLLTTGMAQDFSWAASAHHYQAIYAEAIATA
jgi:starch synthase